MKPTKQESRRGSRITGVPVSIGVTIMVLIAVCAPGLAQGQSAPLRRIHLDMVFSTGLFHSVNRNDAVAAVRVWASMIGHSRGFQVDPNVDVVDNAAEIRKRVLDGTAGIIALDVVEYFELADLTAVEPVFCAMKGEGSVPPHYIMAVRADSGISSLEGLRGKSAIIHANTGANLGQVWLDAMLYDAHLGRPEIFFGSLEVVPKASSAILPVFFGKADAAIVDEGSFEVSKEMNPQVGTKLRLLSVSPPLPEGLLCICRKQVEFREDLVASLRDLYLDPQGKQILMVFGFGRLMLFDKLELEPVRDLWRKHKLLCGLPGKAQLTSLSRQDPNPVKRFKNP